MKKIRRYSELMQLNTFDERLKYLLLDGAVGIDTFGFDRYLNQVFYRSLEWKRVRDQVIIRDNGCDLGVYGYDITGKILIHHMNPISAEDITSRNPDILNPEFLICVSHKTHNNIHYGFEPTIADKIADRRPGDTCPWKLVQ